METLIELFDDSPVLNILAATAFKPKKLIFFGATTDEAIESRKDYERFFKRRHEVLKIEYVSVNLFDIKSVEATLEKIIKENPDCVVDVTGGKDIALLAAGMAAIRLNVPLVAYNKETEKYVNMSMFEKAEGIDTLGLMDCHDFFCVSGGNITDFADFREYKNDKIKFWQMVMNVWQVYLRHMGEWASHVQYLQKVTHPIMKEGPEVLRVVCPPIININSKELRRRNDIISELRECGVLVNFGKRHDGKISFEYVDSNFKRYLTDVGAFLELYIHVCALRTGIFSDVLSRVKYNWEYNTRKQLKTTICRPASNEIDVIAIRGIEPLYISCKTSSPDMKYIDEIYPQAMRMSGGEGHAVFACTHTIDKDMPIYNKAKALGVYIIDGEDIKNNLVVERLTQMAERRYVWKDEPEYQAMLKKNALTIRSD